MNLFSKLLNFNFVFGLSLDYFHQSRLSKEARMKKMKIGDTSSIFKVNLRLV
jgi:hypothetical protein